MRKALRTKGAIRGATGGFFVIFAFSMAGIYFHIPFCKRICAYCDFPRSADLRCMEPLAGALHRELEARSGYLHEREIRTIYFGGGTPSLYSPEILQGLIDHARTLFGFGRPEEITAECNPDDLTDDYLARLRDTEIDRLSIGIQSFDDGCLKLMNRRHTGAEAIRAVEKAQQAGFDNITIDLIFGVRGFGGETLHQTLRTALSLGVQHISAYHLTIEPDTALGRRAARGEFGPVEEEVSDREFTAVHDTLTAGGYDHYEVSNYALPGRRACHNASYWTGTEYLGIGPGAHSFNGTERRWCDASVEEYLTSPHYENETLTPRDHYNEYLMTGLRTAGGIDLRIVEERFGEERRRRIESESAPFITAGLLLREEDRLRIPPGKFLVSDSVIGALFDV